tara:strand:+ start:197 stop:370 length:174 start_codon:yes stop_codon:yes gene_type:complete
MNYSLIVVNELTNSIVFHSSIYEDTKDNMKHLEKLYDDYQNTGFFICKFIEHGATNV